MSGILDKKKRFIDFIVTSHGKRKLAENDFFPSFASLSDKTCVYSDSDNKNINFKEKSIKNVSNHDKISLETSYKSTNDVIVYEFDDSGKLFIQDISGSSVTGNKIFVYNQDDATDIRKRIATGSLFASNNSVTDASIKRFKRNKFIKTSDFFEDENNTFEIFPKKHTFVMSNSIPFPKGPLTEGINIDNAEPLMFDDKLAHFGNFQYLPPVNIDGTKIANYEDLRGTSKKTYDDIKNSLRIDKISDNFLEQSDTVINQINITTSDSLKVLNRKPLKDISTKIAKEHVSINFKNTSYQNNIILQIYEKNYDLSEFTKLDIVDAGEFFDENDKNRPKKHVYYVGKIYEDRDKNSTFVNLFTLIWD